VLSHLIFFFDDHIETDSENDTKVMMKK